MNASVGRRFVAIWVALVVAGSLLVLAARGAGPLPGDLLSTRLLQRSSSSGVVNLLLTRAGDAVWFLPPLTILIALVGKRWLAAFFALLAASTGVLIPDAIKLLMARPRPATDLVWVLSPQENYGFPSGTAFLSVVFLGTVGYLIWREYPRPHVAVVTFGISLLLILSSGLSRVYVGEHWATDVLGGWCFGGAWLIILVTAHRWWLSRRTRESKAGDPTARTPKPR